MPNARAIPATRQGFRGRERAFSIGSLIFTGDSSQSVLIRKVQACTRSSFQCSPQTSIVLNFGRAAHLAFVVVFLDRGRDLKERRSAGRHKEPLKERGGFIARVSLDVAEYQPGCRFIVR